MIVNLQTKPIDRDEPAAIILRAPDGYTVQELGSVTLETAAATLAQTSGRQVGARFIDRGDTVILLADRDNDRAVENKYVRGTHEATMVQW